MIDRETMLAIEDRPMAADQVRELLAEIDRWCERTGTRPNVFGRVALNFGGYVGLMRLRGTARTRMAALARDFMARWPDGCPADHMDAERSAVRDTLIILRGTPNRRRALRSVIDHKAAAMIDVAPPVLPAVIDRTPCFRCGVRADIGCEHQGKSHA